MIYHWMLIISIAVGGLALILAVVKCAMRTGKAVNEVFFIANWVREYEKTLKEEAAKKEDAPMPMKVLTPGSISRARKIKRKLGYYINGRDER